MRRRTAEARATQAEPLPGDGRERHLRAGRGVVAVGHGAKLMESIDRAIAATGDRTHLTDQRHHAIVLKERLEVGLGDDPLSEITG